MKSCKTLATLSVVVIGVQSGIFRVPIHPLPPDKATISHNPTDTNADGSHRGKQPHHHNKHPEEAKTYEAQTHNLLDNVSLWDINELAYITRLSVRTPAQPFNVRLSLSSSDLSVYSSGCSYCGNASPYNSTLSSSYIPHQTMFYSDYVRGSHYNQLAEDTLHLGEFSINHFKFGETQYSSPDQEPPYFQGRDATHDGAFGLGRHGTSSGIGIRNPLQSLHEQGLLKREMFSIKLPHGQNSQGELILGGADENHFVGLLKTLPVVDNPIKYPRLNGTWLVPATSISVAENVAQFAEDCVAVIDTDYPLIALPRDIAWLLMKHLGMIFEHHSWDVPYVECSDREKMGNLTITLGEHNFTLTPWEYTFESNAYGSLRCITAIKGGENFENNYIILGSVFMRKFYSVFDLENMTVGFAEIPKDKMASDAAESTRVELKK